MIVSWYIVVCDVFPNSVDAVYNRTNHVNVKYQKPPVWNCHSEDKHSINTGILIPSTNKYINMCSIVFIVPFYLII